MNGFAALDIPPCRRYVVVMAAAGFAVCRLMLKLLLFYSCLDFTQNLGETRNIIVVNIDAEINRQNAFGLHQMLHDHIVCSLPGDHWAAGIMDLFRPIHRDLCRPDVVLPELFCHFLRQHIAVCNDAGRILYVFLFAEGDDPPRQAFDHRHPNKWFSSKPRNRKILYAS